jgi:hypothetical protein
MSTIMKTNQVKISRSVCALILGMLLYAGASAQTASSNWTQLNTQNNVSVYYQTNACETDSVIFVRIANNSGSSKTISWSLWGNAVAPRTFTISAGKDISGSCPTMVGDLFTSDLMDQIPSGKTSRDLNAAIIIN